MTFVMDSKRIKTIGKGKPVLVVPGMGGPDILYTFVERLSHDAQVIVPTLPGFLPEDGIIEYSDELYVTFLERLREKLKIDKWDIIGHSMGGRTVVNYSITHPESVSKAVIIDSAGYNNFSPLFTIPVLKNIAPKILNQMFSKPEKLKNFALMDFVHKNSAEANKVVTFFSKMISNNVIRENFSHILGQIGIKKSEWRQLLPELDIPFLILWASKDKTCPVKVAYQLHKLLKSSSLNIHEGYKHLGLLEEPDFYTTRIIEFLNLQKQTFPIRY